MTPTPTRRGPMVRSRCAPWLTALVLAACTFGEPVVPTEPTEPPPPRASFDNRPQCLAFVAHVNQLACVPPSARLVPELVCPEDMQAAACDASAFWACAVARTTCGEGGLEREAVGGCPDPCGQGGSRGQVE